MSIDSVDSVNCLIVCICCVCVCVCVCDLVAKDLVVVGCGKVVVFDHWKSPTIELQCRTDEKLYIYIKIHSLSSYI